MGGRHFGRSKAGEIQSCDLLTRKPTGKPLMVVYVPDMIATFNFINFFFGFFYNFNFFN